MKANKLSVQRRIIGLFSWGALLSIALVMNSFAPATKLTDAEIASVAVAANKIDVDLGKIAKEKSKKQDVINFANLMVKDHQGVIDESNALVKRLKVVPKENDLTRKLNSDADVAKRLLSTKTSADFDKAYIDREVTFHKDVIKTMQEVLIPQAQNAELKAFLQKIMPTLKSHLAHAEMIQKNLGGKKM